MPGHMQATAAVVMCWCFQLSMLGLCCSLTLVRQVQLSSSPDLKLCVVELKCCVSKVIWKR